ncbi:MAG: hypothetical protein RR923_02210, partial [Bacilli bacterium]
VGYNKLNTEGWVTKMGYDQKNPFLQMPQETNGNASIKYGDYYWMNTTTGKRIVLFGGAWYTDVYDGLSIFSLGNSSSYYITYVGSRLLKTAL